MESSCDRLRVKKALSGISYAFEKFIKGNFIVHGELDQII